jgi:hypothetical protein
MCVYAAGVRRVMIWTKKNQEEYERNENVFNLFLG